MAELRPDLDKSAERWLERLERGEPGLGGEFKKLLENHPNHHMTHFGMGVYMAMGQNDPAGAIPFFEKAVRIFPLLAEAHFNLGSAYSAAVRLREAVASFRNAIRYSSAGDGIAEMARQKLGNLERIVLEDSPFLTLDAYLENQRLFDDAFEHLRNRHYAQAVEGFGEVLEQDPKHVQSYGNMALAQAGLGQKAAALASLDKALALDPAYQPARMNRMAIAKMREGEPFIPEVFAETEFYREMAEGNRPRRSWPGRR